MRYWFYANMDNKRSHDIIDKSLEMLRRLDHRAGRRRWHHWWWHRYYDWNTFCIFQTTCNGLWNPRWRRICRGVIFSKERILGSEHEAIFKKYFEGEGLSILGYRNVPVNKDAIAKHVADTMPVIQQVFIDIRDIEDVEKRLF